MKIGIVGYGSIGQRHAANAQKLGHEVLIYDPVLINANGIKFERNIYEKCDALVICTPSPYHESGIRAAIERGKHVLVEKPISTSIGHLPQLLNVAASKNLVVMVGNNLRFHPCVLQAGTWIRNGDIGKPLWAHFTCATTSVKPIYLSDGVILNTGAHEVDMALHLLGPVSQVLSASVDREVEGDVIADFVLLHENGCRSSFHLDFITPNPIRESWIVGDKANIGVDLIGRRTSLGIVPHGFGGSYDDDYLEEMKAFVMWTEDILPPAGAWGQDGLATLKVLLGVRKKAGL